MRREHLFGRCPALRVVVPRSEPAATQSDARDDVERPPAPAAAQAEE